MHVLLPDFALSLQSPKYSKHLSSQRKTRSVNFNYPPKMSKTDSLEFQPTRQKIIEFPFDLLDKRKTITPLKPTKK